MFDIKKDDFKKCRKTISRYLKYKRELKNYPVIPGTILFISFNGRKYDCNPRYIYEYLIMNKIVKPEQCTWTINAIYTKEGMKYFQGKLTDEDMKYFDEHGILYKTAQPEDFPQDGSKLIVCHSDDYVHAVMQSQIIIVNGSIDPYIPIRHKKQLVIGTWHANGAYKTFGFLNKNEFRIDNTLNIFMNGRQYDFMLAGCGAIADVMPKALMINKKKIIRSGLPRNDVLVKGNYDVKDLKRKMGLPEDKLLVLYATTFRSSRRFHVNEVCETLDLNKVGKALKSKFKKDVYFMFRSHYYDEKTKINDSENSGDFSNYRSVMDLIKVADVLITDYSSIQWDFALTRKPAFLFTPDLMDYKEHRNFITPILDWAYPYSTTQDGLIMSIKMYDEENAKKRINDHLKMMDSYDDGFGCENIGFIIRNALKFMNS